MKSIEQRIQSAKRSISNYESNIAMFERGDAIPGIGELHANRLLLKRKKRQLQALQVTQTIKRNVHAGVCA